MKKAIGGIAACQAALKLRGSDARRKKISQERAGCTAAMTFAKNSSLSSLYSTLTVRSAATALVEDSGTAIASRTALRSVALPVTAIVRVVSLSLVRFPGRRIGIAPLRACKPLEKFLLALQTLVDFLCQKFIRQKSHLLKESVTRAFESTFFFPVKDKLCTRFCTYERGN